MNFRFLFLLIAGVIIFSSCSKKVLFTQGHRDRIERIASVDNLQFYNDRAIKLIYKSRTALETKGDFMKKAKFKDGFFYYTLTVDEKTPAIAKPLNDSSLKVYFEKEGYFVFQNYGNSYQIGGNSKASGFQIEYEGYPFVPKKGGDAKLLFKDNWKKTKKKKKRKLKGMKVK